MKRQSLAGIVFLAGIGYLTGMAWKPAPQGPRLEVSPHVQLGMLIHSEERTVRIGFRNSGEQPLTVEALVLGCQCAKPKLDRKSAYEPGEAGWFEVTMKPAAPPGSPYQQQVQLDSNDPRRPRQFVLVEGEMQSALTVSPARLRVEHAVVGQPWRRKLTIGRAGNGANFQIVGLTCTVPSVELSEPAQLSVDERVEYQVEVRHPGASSIGQQTGQIEILTNSLTVPRLLVPVDIQVSSYVKIDPAVVLFRDDDLKEQHVRLTASSAFQLTSTFEDDAWDFQIDSLDETQKCWQVSIRPKTAAPAKPQRGTFPLTVNGIGPEHEVSISYVLLPPSTGE